ncbi:MAG: hypothetical protein KGL39_54280 [Patescibacteria group bacterium]|nr:hypothetical protein [Patescibacteria group bacterium]
MKRGGASPASPTPGPWEIEDECLVYRHWRYAGWPHFGRIIVARLDSSWPIGPERDANRELIAVAVNACFAVAPESPITAANAFPALVSAVRDVLAHGDDPHRPPPELRARLRAAFREATGGAL